MEDSLSPVAAGPPADPEFHLGVLFVHGIGQQTEGETLVSFGDPLLRWLRRWCVGAVRADWEKAHPKDPWPFPEELVADKCVQVRDTRSAADGAGPASSVVVSLALPQFSHATRPPQDDGEQVILEFTRRTPVHWLLAESCWAGKLVTPHFAELAYWGLVIYPWASVSHFGARVRRRWNAWKDRTLRGKVALAIPEALRTVGIFVLSLLLALLGVLALVMLLILALPPIPPLRKILQRAQQSLANTVGDSFILISSPIQRAAIISRVRADLEKLLARCGKVCVIAHSQGAAVAFETLSSRVIKDQTEVGVINGWTADNFMFISFGSGLGKLEEIRWMLGSAKQWMGWLPILGVLLLWWSVDLIGLADVVPFLGQDRLWGFIAACGGLFCWLGVAYVSATQERFTTANFEPRTRFDAECLWCDYFASQDPVPNGPLLEKKPDYLTSTEVSNFHSVWADHTTYWANRDEFIPLVVRKLGKFCGLPITKLLPGDEGRIDFAVRRRQWRVRWLAGARVLAILLTLGMLAGQTKNLGAIGEETLARVQPLESVLGWIIPESILSTLKKPAALLQGVAGALALGAVALLGYCVLRLAWGIWNWNDASCLPRRVIADAKWFWVFILLGLVLADAAIFMGAGLLHYLQSLKSQPSFATFAAPGLCIIPLVAVRAWKGDENWRASVPEGLVVGLCFAPVVGGAALLVNNALLVALDVALGTLGLFLAQRWHRGVGPAAERSCERILAAEGGGNIARRESALD